MRSMPILSVAIGVLIATTPAHAAEQIFTPKGKWVVDYGVDQCTVLREFANGEKAVTLLLSRAQSGDGMRVQVVGKLPLIAEQNGDISVQFLPNGSINKGFYYSGKTKDGTTSVMTASAAYPHQYSEDAADQFVDMGGRTRLKPEVRSTLNGLTMRIGRRDPMVFQTGGLGPVLNVLENCTDTLAVHWGFDDATEKGLTKRPEALNDMSKWVRPMDYPTYPLNNGGVATVDFRLTVEADGRVSDCYITNAAGDEAFSRVVCSRITERAKLSPALDRDGKPVRSFFISRVNFIM